VTVQLPSPVAGVLVAQAVPVGATVKVGDVIGSVQPGAAKAEVRAAAPAQPAVAVAPASAAVGPAGAAAAPPARTAAAPASAVPAPAPERPSNGDGLDKAALLKLTPSQRAAAREVGTIPQHGAPVARSAAAPAGPSAEDRLAQVDPRDEVVAM